MNNEDRFFRKLKRLTPRPVAEVDDITLARRVLADPASDELARELARRLLVRRAVLDALRAGGTGDGK
ncbi:hypothetical protein SAMN06265795_12928 [Noviherbaspirillum humi]|uniref:Uncharacterized protein n=1 Tax=Noviherbaspirillum humi TaxID=1688639 RepID=A0A239M306_9BURK|nr:hypothetical protein [Noviherbaspirillum humi]SNT36344.1 hypothetical protein SAMN06265795_12928 [Noviherbaspirillum humi]